MHQAFLTHDLSRLDLIESRVVPGWIYFDDKVVIKQNIHERIQTEKSKGCFQNTPDFYIPFRGQKIKPEP